MCVSVCASVTASGCALACAHACMCVLHTAALGVPVHLNPVGVEVGVGNARWGGLGSPWFPLLPPEGAAQVPSWQWMARPEGGMLRPLAPHSLCGDRCSCRGPVPLHRPNITPISSPASSHQVSALIVHRGDREGCLWKPANGGGTSGGMGPRTQPPLSQLGFFLKPQFGEFL